MFGKLVGLFSKNSVKYGQRIGNAGKYKIYQKINENGEKVVTSLKKDGSIFKEVRIKNEEVKLAGQNYQNKKIDVKNFDEKTRTIRSTTHYYSEGDYKHASGVYRKNRKDVLSFELPEREATYCKEFSGNIENISKPGEYYATFHQAKNGIYTWSVKDKFLDHVRTIKGFFASNLKFKNGTSHSVNSEIRRQWDPIEKKYVEIRPRAEQKVRITYPEKGNPQGLTWDSRYSGNNTYNWNVSQK